MASFYVIEMFNERLFNQPYKLKSLTMKKILSILMITALFTACKSKTAVEKEVVGTSGTTLKSTIASDTSRTTKVRVLPNGTTTTTTVTTVGKPPIEKEHVASSHKTEKVYSNSNGSGNTKSTSSTTTTNSNPAPASNRKKGWSDAAVGATMGGLSGAAIGAVVSKDKAKGAIIGGVVGAGTGYVIGRAGDRKSGRVQKKKVVTTTTTTNN